MDPLTIGLIGAGLSAANTAIGAGTSAANLKLEKQNLKWQKHVQRKTWKREDTAVRRRARDLEAAGMSRTLAAGGSAQAGSVVHTDAPQREKEWDLSDAAEVAQNMLRMKNDFHMSDVQRELMAEQIVGQHYKNEHQLVMNNLATYDFLKALDSGMSSKASGPAKVVYDLMGLVKKGLQPRKAGIFNYSLSKTADNVKNIVADKVRQVKKTLKLK